MKPKKIILIVDNDEVTVSIRRLVFECHGFRVLVATDQSSAVELAQTERIAVALIERAEAPHTAENIARLLKIVDPEVRVVLTEAYRVLRSSDARSCADFILGAGVSMEQIVSTLRSAAARRCGPKAGTTWTVPDCKPEPSPPPRIEATVTASVVVETQPAAFEVRAEPHHRRIFTLFMNRHAAKMRPTTLLERMELRSRRQSCA